MTIDKTMIMTHIDMSLNTGYPEAIRMWEVKLWKVITFQSIIIRKQVNQSITIAIQHIATSQRGIHNNLSG